MLKELFSSGSTETTVAAINKTTSSLRHVTIHANACVHRDAEINLNSQNQLFTRLRCNALFCISSRPEKLKLLVDRKCGNRLRKFRSRFDAQKAVFNNVQPLQVFKGLELCKA